MVVDFLVGGGPEGIVEFDVGETMRFSERVWWCYVWVHSLGCRKVASVIGLG